MGKQYRVIYLQDDNGCFVRCVWDCVFTCGPVKFLFLDAEEHSPELTHTHTHAQRGKWLAAN